MTRVPPKPTHPPAIITPVCFPSPGVLGWIGVGLMVALADGYALRKKKRTMSDVFARHRGWAVFILGGTVAHLVGHESR